MLNLQPLAISKFNGRWSRGSEFFTPPDHFVDEANLRYSVNGFHTREGSVLVRAVIGVGNWNGSVYRMHPYSRPGEVDRLIILDDSGNLWDDSQGFTSPILTIATPNQMTDFNVAVANNRLYITPSDGLTGLPGEKVYVYEGSGVARAAAGPAPTGFTLTATKTSAGSGHVLKGKRLFQLMYETSSGHYTKPGPASATLYDADVSDAKVTVGNIPNKPANVVSIHILATQVIDSFSGNKLEYEFFHVPNAILVANESSVELDFYDSDLIDSADDLNWLLETIPAGVALGICDNRLITCGEDANQNIARVSKRGYPESFSSLSGFVETPDDGSGAVRNICEYRGQLMLYKSRRHYATSPSSNDPNTWLVVVVDVSFGTECHGIGKVLDAPGYSDETLLTADRTGIRRFIGNYSLAEITYKVSSIWERINTDYFDTIQIAIDPDEMCIYAAIPLDAATLPSHILMGDFSEGWEEDKIKWSLWNFKNANVGSICIITDDKFMPSFYIGSPDGGIWKLSKAATNDFSNVIDSFFQLPYMGDDEKAGIIRVGGIRIVGRGSGYLDVYYYGIDRVLSGQAQTINMTATPGGSLTKNCNVVNERISFKFVIDSINEWFNINEIILFMRQLWSGRPM